MTSYMELVQNKLVELAESGLFRENTYDENKVTTLEVVAQPRSVEANETGCEFGQRSVRTRQSLERDRQRWRWELIVSFDSHVSDQLFLERLNTKPFQVDETESTRPVALNLLASEYTHPPRANPSNGSRIRYEFEAIPAPK